MILNSKKTISRLEELYIKSKPAIASVLEDNLPVNIFLTDADGYIAWGNERMLKTLNLSSLNEFVGKHISDWDAERWQYCLRVINSKQEHTEEESAAGKYYFTTRKPLLDASNNVIGVIGVSVDITERKQAELAKKEFLENMSHDLRTPFTGILSLSEYLYLNETDPLKKELLGEILNSGKWLLSLLNQVLEISTLGAHPLNFSKFKLTDIIHQITDLLHAEIRHKGLHVEISCPDDITLNSDRMRISRILLNLMGNAVKYTQEGFIKVKVYRSSSLRIDVEDSGKGIPTDSLETIFNRFSKLNPSYQQQQFSGAGIGLHIAREYARELGGDIIVTSEVDKGSCFTLLLKR